MKTIDGQFVCLADLQAWQDNYNEGDIGYIAKAIETFGYNRTVSVWHNATVMAGNHTRHALNWLDGQGVTIRGNVRYHEGELYIQFSDCSHLDEQEAHDYAIADNEAARRATQDEIKLGQWLKHVAEQDEQTGSNRLEVLGYDPVDVVDLLRRNNLLASQQETTEPDDAGQTASKQERAAPANDWGVNQGDIFEIKSTWGFSHYLMCADSTHAETHDALFGAISAIHLIHADPPYGINITGGNKPLGQSVNSFEIAGDDKPFDPAPFLRLDVPVIFWGANHFANKLPASPHWLVWDKQGGAKDIDFASCELAWSSVPKPARVLTHIWDGFRRDSERGEKRIHTTQKPVAVIRWALDWHDGNTVFVPFSGSGSALLACDEIGRQCYACEIMPEIVSVSLTRFVDKGLQVTRLT